MRDAERRIAVFTAVLAVVAALATLLAHHRSIVALSDKNGAILAQTRASDAFNSYETRRTKTLFVEVLAEAGIASPAAVRRLTAQSRQSEEALVPLLERARGLEAQADALEARSEKELSAYEVMQTAVTLFDVAIVFASISALTSRARPVVVVSAVLSLAGAVFFFIGILRHF
ncbi:MAG: DUF4337 family protein [Candidatus Eremiobacteraeota bacterium]|nr:DUF4337 family protein [Candidatus Eremiobacteraeota bacterium]